MANPREFYNHDIGEMSSPDMVAAQQKLFAGGEMKSSIKHFLDWWDRESIYDRAEDGPPLIGAMRAAMERWCNCG